MAVDSREALRALTRVCVHSLVADALTFVAAWTRVALIQVSFAYLAAVPSRALALKFSRRDSWVCTRVATHSSVFAWSAAAFVGIDGTSTTSEPFDAGTDIAARLDRRLRVRIVT